MIRHMSSAKYKKTIFRVLKVSLLLYAFAGIILYYAQDLIFFSKASIKAEKPYSNSARFSQIVLPFNTQDSIVVARFSPKDKNQVLGAVLFLHDQGENIEEVEKMTDLFVRSGFEVWVPDYPGFGKSSGVFEEPAIHEQMFQVRKLMSNYFDASKVSIAGVGLGACLASNLACFSNNRQLILISPFYSMPDLQHSYTWIYPWRLMTWHSFPTWKYLQDVKIPVTVMYDDSYGKTTWWSCKKLRSVLKTGDQFQITHDIRKQDGEGYATFMTVLNRSSP